MRVASLALVLIACGASPPVAQAPTDPDAGPIDRDHDGTADVDDRCPCEREDLDGFEDDDGCLDFDNDGDRIPDPCDVCPNEPETYDGTCDGDGCPDHGRVIVSESQIAILAEIRTIDGEPIDAPSELPASPPPPTTDCRTAVCDAQPPPVECESGTRTVD